jgi:hypothetical protein
VTVGVGFDHRQNVYLRTYETAHLGVVVRERAQIYTGNRFTRNQGLQVPRAR